MGTNKKYQEAVDVIQNKLLTCELCDIIPLEACATSMCISCVWDYMKSLELPNNCRLAIIDENGNEVKEK